VVVVCKLVVHSRTLKCRASRGCYREASDCSHALYIRGGDEQALTSAGQKSQWEECCWGWQDVPSRVCVQRVQLRLALLTIVLVRHLTVLDNSNTSTMLPHTATVTRYEKSSGVLRLQRGRVEGFTQWRTRIFLLSTDTSRHLFIVSSLVVDFSALLGDVFIFWLMCSLAATRWLAHLFAGAGVWCC
jgi:hypothetical protein